MDSSDIYTNKKEELELKGEEKPIDYTIPVTAVGKTEEITFPETEQVIIGRNVGRSISSPIDLGEETIISEGDNKIDFQQYRLTNIKEPEEDSDAATKNYVDSHSSSLTAGDNITIVDNVISATDTTYSNFTGTDGVDPGTAGLVPAPATTDAGKYLKADGTWDTVSAGPTVVQTTGTSATDVMSQNATTSMIFQDPSTKKIVRIGNTSTTNYDVGIAIGNGASSSLRGIAIGSLSTQSGGFEAVAIGSRVTANGTSAIAIGGANTDAWKTYAMNMGSIAIGRGAESRADDGVALGPAAKVLSGHSYSIAFADSTTSRTNEASFGNPTGAIPTRYLANVTDPQLAQDAATKNYVDSFYPVGTVYSSTSSTAPTFAGGTWTQLGSQTIGSSTVYYYERTA